MSVEESEEPKVNQEIKIVKEDEGDEEEEDEDEIDQSKAMEALKIQCFVELYDRVRENVA